MNINFVDTIEFEVFCDLSNIDLETIKNQRLNQNTNQQKQEFCEYLSDLITKTNIDEREYQLTLAKSQLDPEILKTFDKLGIGLREQDKLLAKQGLIAMDYVIDSTSVFTSFQSELGRLGIIFCSMSEAIKQHPELVRKYLGSVVPFSDNYFASLNSAVFSDGSFCYIPPNVVCSC